MRYTAAALALLPALLFACHDAPVAPDDATPPSFAKPGGGSVTVTNLNLSGSGQDSRAEDINAAGRIVGWRGPWNSPNNAFIWIPTADRGTVGTATNLTSLGGEAMAFAINGGGYVGGMSRTGAGDIQHAVLWQPQPGGYSGAINLGSPLNGGLVWDLNDFDAGNKARAVGHSDISAPHALVWDLSLGTDGTVSASSQPLPQLAAGMSAAFGLNKAGSVAVGYSDHDGGQRPVRWTHDVTGWVPLELPLLPHDESRPANGVAQGINTQGQIVGHNFFPSLCAAFVWTPGGPGDGLRQLPPLGRSTCDLAYKINDAGQVAGASGGHAVLWTVGPTTISIRDLGKPSRSKTAEGHALNEPAGDTEVVGFGRNGSGAESGSLWTVR